jgi:NADH dehydrogenase
MSERICILGGGFGGLYTALKLSQFPWDRDNKPEIVLIDRKDRFLFSPLLYELVTGEMETWEVAPPFTELLSDTEVKFEQAIVTGIDIEAKQIHLANSTDLKYDRLVIALGGTTPTDLVPGAVEHTIPFRTLEDAYRLQEKLRHLESSENDIIRVAIVGGGYSGVELACKVSERLGEKGRVRLIEKGDSILSNSPQFNRETATKALEERKIWLDLETSVEKISQTSISLSYKQETEEIPVDVVLWTVGNRVPELIQTLPLKQNNKGLLTVTPTLQTIEHKEIFVLGDAADCRDADDQTMTATAQVAFQQSDYCAWNLWATINDKPLLPFHYLPLGEMMALGTDNATLSGLGINLNGSIAYVARRLIYLYRLPTWKHQLNVGLNWIAAPILEALS